MAKKNKRKEVLALIRALRGSFPDAGIVYTYGACYGLYEILKAVFPEAKAYFSNEEEEHVVVKIGEDFYDIVGLMSERVDKPKIMKEKDIQYWEGVASTQRFERMLGKYNYRNARLSIGKDD